MGILMQVFSSILILALLLGGALIVWGGIKLLVAVWTAEPVQPGTRTLSADAADEIDGMNEGDIHSGPYGYSPNTAYPQTQYGSDFNEDAEWAHEHED